MMGNGEITKGGAGYIGYDYKAVTVTTERMSMYLDMYKNFGWELDDSASTKQFAGTASLKLKRDRKIINKAELTRLQQHFEACMDEITTLECSKTRKASACSMTVGIIGTAFMAGSVFAVTHSPPIIWLCAVLGVIGIIGWALPYRIYKKLARKRADETTPLIEQKYDEIHEICEKGKSLIS